MKRLNSSGPLDEPEDTSCLTHHDLTGPNEEDQFDMEVPVNSTQPSMVAMIILALRKSCSYVMDHWKVLALGQGLSFLLACSGATQATLHFDCSLSAPAFSAGLFYILLSLYLIPLYRKGRQFRGSRQISSDSEHDDSEAPPPVYWFLGVIPLHSPAWGYLMVALMDVEANFVTVLAFRYTTLSSVSLLDALAIPSAMVFGYLLLGRRHTWVHMIGIGACMMGTMYNALADYESDRGGSVNDGGEAFPHKLKGDILAIAGGLMFGANNVLTEMLVRGSGGSTEYLGMLGLFAAIIAMTQAFFLERGEIQDFFDGVPDPDGKVCSRNQGIFLVIGFMVINAVSYSASSYFLQVSEATLLNLSLLTGDLWSVVFMVVAEGIFPQPLFYAALTMIVAGVIIYEMGPSPIVDASHQYNFSVWLTKKMSNDDLDNIDNAICGDIEIL